MYSRLLNARTTVFAPFVLVGGLSAGCADDRSDPRAGVERAPIVNGELSDESDDEVVDIYARVSDSDVLHCTGTLIAPDVVVTALHCVTYRDDPNATFTCRSDGSLTSTTPGAGILGAPVAPGNVEVFFGATHDLEPDAIGTRVFGSGSTQICRGDIAVVVLDRELGQKVAPVRFGRGVPLGERTRIVGYGQTEQAVSGARYRRSGLRVLNVGPNSFGGSTTNTPPNTFVLGEGACHGDSGGPALSEATGALVGVYSLSAGITCTATSVRNFFTSVPPFEDLLRDALEYAGRDPVLEPVPDAGTPDSGIDGGEGGAAGAAGGGEAGAESGGTSGTGNGAGGGTGGMDSAGGTGAEPSGGGEPEDPGGSGSRRDPSCGCRTPGAPGSDGRGALLLLAVAFALRVASGRRGCPDRGCGRAS